MWEKRYHWPIPKRLDNGYRVYSRTLVADIERLADLLQRDFQVGEIIRDGKPCWPTELVPKPKRRIYDFSQVPAPRMPEGQRVRAKLEEAINKGDTGTMAWAEAQLPLLHPLDRGPAVLDLLRLAGHKAS
jgi:hypothetical protein